MTDDHDRPDRVPSESRTVQQPAGAEPHPGDAALREATIAFEALRLEPMLDKAANALEMVDMIALIVPPATVSDAAALALEAAAEGAREAAATLMPDMEESTRLAWDCLACLLVMFRQNSEYAQRFLDSGAAADWSSVVVIARNEFSTRAHRAAIIARQREREKQIAFAAIGATPPNRHLH